MRITLIFKQLDILAQLLSLIIPLMLHQQFRDDDFMIVYFSVGSVQAVSCLCNRIFLKAVYRSARRGGYETILIMVLAPVAFFWSKSMEGFIFFEAVIMMFISPFLAIWYAMITLREIIAIKQIQAGDIADNIENVGEL